MLKKIFISVISLSITFNLLADKLTVYVPTNYFEWMKSLPAIQKFQKENNCQINFVSFDGSAKIVGRLMLEKFNPRADIVMGLSKVTFLQAKKHGLLSQYKPSNSKLIKKDFIVDEQWFGTAFDYGKLALLYNPSKMPNPPKSFSEIAKLKNVLIMSDPRTSTTGQDFLLWTIAAFKDKWVDFWKKFKHSIVTVSPSWSSAFAGYELGKAPLMVSYASDEAYSEYTYHKSRFKVLIPEEGSYMQVELNAVVKRKKINTMAEKFIDLMLTPEVQKTIPTGNWMLPVTNVELPDVIKKYYPLKGKVLNLSNEEIEKNIDNWLKTWQSIMIR